MKAILLTLLLFFCICCITAQDKNKPRGVPSGLPVPGYVITIQFWWYYASDSLLVFCHRVEDGKIDFDKIDDILDPGVYYYRPVASDGVQLIVGDTTQIVIP